MNYIILIFESTHKVLKADKILMENKIKFDIIPTPKEISSDCGMSIRINPSFADMNFVQTLLKDAKIDFTIYEKEIK
ncbi:MAG: DUF3343 domain-containing protein [Bacteroidetes bacterium]|nr:DUF3343 domain-containing protein [Bacteroidota bacterium]